MPQPVTQDWSLRSWREKEALQQPTYPDETALGEKLDHVSALPPLVTSWEVENLKDEIARAAQGDRFLLQGGECAESFGNCRADIITGRLKILMQMSLVLTYGLNTRIVRVGRFAGQYAKPRSSDTETRNGTTLPSYRGDIINGPEFSAEARRPDPQRMVEAYSSSSHAIVDAIEDTLGFFEAVTDQKLDSVESVTFYTSHEALLLPYEEALSRSVPHKNGIYNLGTHLPWVGKRTNQIENAHVEYARGIENPVGLKVGPDMTPSKLQTLVRTLDPDDEPGKL
ncbi:MAG: 3-deoxy-7-phosphoheptulonate synthase class II, partial [Bacteroidetes bacterium QH_1_64_81]